MNLDVLMDVTYGMYLVASKYENKYSGMIATTVCQVTSNPIQFSVTINKQNLTHNLITNSGKLVISILSEQSPVKLIGIYGFSSGRNVDKLLDRQYLIGINDILIVSEGVIGYIEGKVTNIFDVGTHSIFILEVIDSKKLDNLKPMTYAYYRKNLKGKSPELAPTYLLNKLDM